MTFYQDPPEIIAGKINAPVLEVNNEKIALPCPPFMSFSFCLYYKYLCCFSQSDYVMFHHFFTIAFIQSKYRWYRLQAKLLQKQSACMFFIQSRKIHFLFIAGPYFKISAVTTSTHLSNAAFSFASS
jgi:hypothetical protein